MSMMQKHTPSDLLALQILKDLVPSVLRTRQVHSVWKWIAAIPVPEALRQGGLVLLDDIRVGEGGAMCSPARAS